MTDATLLANFRHWQRFSQQERLNREHRAAIGRLEQSGAMANRLAEAYRNMAAKGAEEGACYRTLFSRAQDDGSTLTCEGWLFVRRVIAEKGSTRVRGSMLEVFDLQSGRREPQDAKANAVTLELFDQISTGRGVLMSCRVDRHDKRGDTHFITFLDAVENYKGLMKE